MELAIKHTGIFTKNYDALINPDIRFIVNQGGSRSSKTYSICQLIIWYCLTNKNKYVSVIRKTMPALSATVLVDFINILAELDLDNQVLYNKSEKTFTFRSGSNVKFFSVDDPQKLRGRRHDLVFLNEANELNTDDWLQINMRTTGTIILDFNPSDQFSYIYDILKDEKATMIHSTYKDNPFLDENIIREIENLKYTRPEEYQIYALGLNTVRKERIFQNISYAPFPNDIEWVYGMDWGFVDPTTLVKAGIRDGNLYLKEELYESYLTIDDILDRFNKLEVSKKTRIWADSSRPDMITTVLNAGYYITKSNKNISEGLDFMRNHNIIIDPTSVNMGKEFENYSFKKIFDRVTDTPVDLLNHSIDAARYASISFKNHFKLSVGWA